MKNIEQFNNQLNRRRYRSDALSKDFNSQIDLLLKSTFAKLEQRRKIIVIGAGNMSEISLEMLLRFFDEIILTDVDIDTLTDTVRYMRLPAKLRSRIECRRVEYTGFEQTHFFEDFKERIVNCRTPEKIKQVIESKLQPLKRYRFLKDDENIDFIYVSPIYTQLIYHQVLEECKVLEESGYPKHLISYIRDYMLDEMVNVIERFNSNLVSKLQKGGMMFVLSDIFQLPMSSGFYRRVKNSIRNYSVMEELYEGYKEKYGMGLGDYGLYNLNERLTETLSRWLIWPFDEESSFIVKLKIYSK